jgi:hypothetical protein
MKLNRGGIALVFGVAVVVGAVLAGGGAAGPGRGSMPTGHSAAQNSIKGLASLFSVNPLLGGQVAPRSYKWVNDNVSIFVQFDRPNPAEATTVRYVGIGVKGAFCSEAQPGGSNGGFTHFHRLTSPTYAQGHGGPPGTMGYWLLWVAVDSFTAGDRKVAPGVDYGFSPTPAPACGATVPKPDFQGPGAHALTRAEIKQLANFFHDNPFLGGQVAPRAYRWVNGDTLVFLQFDKPDPAKATALRYIGISTRGAFCKADPPSVDFTHFDRLTAKTYAQGAGGKPGQGGFWSLALAVDDFDMPWGHVTPGADRKFAVTRAPDCPKA